MVRFMKNGDPAARFSQNFSMEITERTRLSATKHDYTFVVSGELSCELPDPDTEKMTRHAWQFRATCRRENGVLFLLDLPQRDRSGTFSTFIRALIWEFLQDLT